MKVLEKISFYFRLFNQSQNDHRVTDGNDLRIWSAEVVMTMDMSLAKTNGKKENYFSDWNKGF